jgi:nucleotide-binding universal stress UspA family protein
VPFIVVQKREYREGYNKIVIPLDDSIESRQKLKWAIYIAKQFDAVIHIKALYRSDELYKAKIRAVLNKVVEVFDKNEVKFDAEFVADSASFAKQVIDYTKKVDADLIMIMTNQDSSPIPNFLLNPWDEQIIFNETNVPVMTINPRDINITIVGM